MKRSYTVFSFKSLESEHITEETYENDLILGDDGRVKVVNRDSRSVKDLEFRSKKDAESDSFYSKFSPSKWGNFISRLNPLIVHNLNLRQDREMIEFYNFCLSSNVEISKNRSKAIGTIPLIREVIFDDKWASVSESFIRDIDNGLPQAEGIKKYIGRFGLVDFKWATEGFLRAISKAPLSTAIRFGELLSEGLLIDGVFDAKNYGFRVGYIPRYRENLEEFKTTLQVFQNILRIEVGSDKAKARLLINIKDNWSENLITDHYLGVEEKDYFKAMARDLFLPIYLLNIQERNPEKLDRAMTDSGYMNQMVRLIADHLADEASRNLTPQKLQGYINRWARNRSIVNGRKPLVSREIGEELHEDEWYRVIADQEIEGYSYKVLTNQNSLNLEAQHMKSCIAGFAEVCKDGGCSVISGTSFTGERFTMDVRKNRSDQFVLREVVGVSGKAGSCSKESEIAARNLVSLMNEGVVATNPKSGAITDYRDIYEYLKFDPLNSDHRQAVFALYQDLRILPKEWQKYESIDQLILEEEIDVIKAIDDFIPSNFPRAPSREDLMSKLSLSQTFI